MAIKENIDNLNLIAVDLDGTLLDSNKKYSHITTEYLKNLKKEGNVIVIATGRILNFAIDVTDGAEFANYLISDAGATIYDVEKKEVISKKTIKNQDVIKICTEYEETWDRINICNEDYYNIYTNKEYKVRTFERLILDKQEFLKNCKDITHISVIAKQDTIETLKENLQKLLPDLKITIMQDSFSHKRWVEIFNKEVDKYNAIKEIADMKNIDNKRIISFGDGLNDVEMIRKSGTGVAMGNALPKLKEVADFVTLSNEENGIKVFLEKFL